MRLLDRRRDLELAPHPAGPSLLSLLARGGGAKKSPTKPIGPVSAIQMPISSGRRQARLRRVFGGIDTSTEAFGVVDEGFELRHSMFPEFTPRLVDRYIERFSDGFDSIDLRRHSKVRNPQLKSYTFGFAHCWRGSA